MPVTTNLFNGAKALSDKRPYNKKKETEIFLFADLKVNGFLYIKTLKTLLVKMFSIMSFFF